MPLAHVSQLLFIRFVTPQLPEENADRGCDQRICWLIKIGSKLVRDERYLVCRSADPKNRSNSRNTAPVLDPHRSSRRQQSFHLSVSTVR